MEKDESDCLSNAMDVADFILYLADCDHFKLNLTNRKLQSLLVIIQCASIQYLNSPCFSDPIEEWTYGHTIPSVYQRYSFFGGNIIWLFRNQNSVAHSILKSKRPEELKQALPLDLMILIQDILPKIGKLSREDLTLLAAKLWTQTEHLYTYSLISKSERNDNNEFM